MPYPQSGVVIAHDPFGAASNRPYLLLSDDRHPFHGQEYIAAVVTTTDREKAIPLETDAFEEGSLPRQSYVSPWNPVTLKEYQIDKRVATLSETIVDDVVAELHTYIGTD
jgi:mRNA-degrading endonuclease toxin of MazEF toxin-antitoxin module